MEQACGFQILPDESEQAAEGGSVDMVLVLAEDADLGPLNSALQLLSSGISRRTTIPVPVFKGVP